MCAQCGNAERCGKTVNTQLDSYSRTWSTSFFISKRLVPPYMWSSNGSKEPLGKNICNCPSKLFGPANPGIYLPQTCYLHHTIKWCFLCRLGKETFWVFTDNPCCKIFPCVGCSVFRNLVLVRISAYTKQFAMSVAPISRFIIAFISCSRILP